MKKIIDLRKEYDEQINSIVHGVTHSMDGLRGRSTSVRQAEGENVESCYIGTVFNIMPSGKYYTGWTSNQNWVDVVKDTYFRQKLEEKLNDLGFWLESGEGSSTDMFACRSLQIVVYYD